MTTQATSKAHKSNVNWFEIIVSDIAKATRLYEATLDTTLKQDLFEGVPNAFFFGPDKSIGALVADPKRPARGGGSTVIYLAVPNVAHALARAVEAGAKVVQPETAIGPQGHIGLFADFDGNVIGLHTPVK